MFSGTFSYTMLEDKKIATHLALLFSLRKTFSVMALALNSAYFLDSLRVSHRGNVSAAVSLHEPAEYPMCVAAILITRGGIYR